MKTCLKISIAAMLMAGIPVVGQSPAPEIRFDSSIDLLKLPANIHLGEVAGVATNSHGDIFVYTRTGHPTISLGTSRPFAHGGSRLFQFDKTGKFIRELGQGSYGFLVAQQLRVDPQGQPVGCRSDVEHGHKIRLQRADPLAAGQKIGVRTGSCGAGWSWWSSGGSTRRTRRWSGRSATRQGRSSRSGTGCGGACGRPGTWRAGCSRCISTADRRSLGRCWKHLRRGWIRQRSSGQVRQTWDVY